MLAILPKKNPFGKLVPNSFEKWNKVSFQQGNLSGKVTLIYDNPRNLNSHSFIDEREIYVRITTGSFYYFTTIKKILPFQLEQKGKWKRCSRSLTLHVLRKLSLFTLSPLFVSFCKTVEVKVDVTLTVHNVLCAC